MNDHDINQFIMTHPASAGTAEPMDAAGLGYFETVMLNNPAKDLEALQMGNQPANAHARHVAAIAVNDFKEMMDTMPYRDWMEPNSAARDALIDTARQLLDQAEQDPENSAIKSMFDPAISVAGLRRSNEPG